MSGNVVNQTPYLRTSRHFPQEAQPLAVEVNRSYVDTANAVNQRTIGIFPTNFPAITGESWFVNNNQRQQTLRQVYLVTGAGNIAHGINFANIAAITKIYGTFTDGTNWYPLPYVDVVSATNQVNVLVNPTNIVIAAGAGAPPAIVSGYVVLEWLSVA
jgi:hypothetical protein